MNSKAKGNAFERQVCRDLSMWVTGADRSGLFARNIISGGQFTNRVKAGDDDTGVAGDVMARDKDAYEFLSIFAVECKHHADMGFEPYLYDVRGSSSLGKIITKCQREAAQARVHAMLVVKQNRRDPLVLLQARAGQTALRCVGHRLALPYHALHSGAIYVFDFQKFRDLVRVREFLARMKS